MNRTLALAIIAVAVVGLCQAQIPGPSQPGLPPEKYEGRLVDSLLVPAWARRRDLPVRVGKPLTAEDLGATERILREDLEKQGQSAFSVRKTLDVTLLRLEVLPGSKPNSVHVAFLVNRMVLTEDDTPGRAMDEASTWTGLQSNVADSSLDFHRDQRLGLPVGFGISTPRHFFKSGVSLKFYWDGWISPTDGFYDMKAGFDLVPGVGFGRERFDCGPEYDSSGLPFGGGELRNISFTAGCSYRFRSRNLESWRANARYRLGFQRLTFPGVAVRRYTDHGFEADIDREYFFGPGFVRLQPWIDGAHSDELRLNIRAGGRVRAYREFSAGSHSLFIADLGLTAGASLFGPVPANRTFVGGSWLNPPLLENAIDTAEYSTMGPPLRGYGFAQFAAVAPTGLFTQTGTSFAGVSLTVSLPGIADRVFDPHRTEERKSLNELADHLTATTRALAMSEYLETSDSVEEARRRARKKELEIGSTVRNLIDHALSLSFRPIAAFDYGYLGSRGNMPGLHDWSAGGGWRVYVRRLGVIEALYSHNGRAIPSLSSSNWMIRYSVRASNLIEGTPVQNQPFGKAP